MEQIIKILLDDADLSTLLGGKHIYPNYTTKEKETAIVYTYNTVSNTNAKKHMRLKVTIIAPDLLRCEQIEARISKLLLTFADLPLTANVVHSEITGGGDIYDVERHMNHHILYIDFLLREVYI